MSNPKYDAELMRAIGDRPRLAMKSAIVSLRNQGLHDLADDLTALRDEWAHKVMDHAGRCERAAPTPPKRPALRVPRPQLRVVPVEQNPTSHARAPVEIQHTEPEPRAWRSE